MAGYDFKIGINAGDSSATIERLIAEIKKIGITAQQIVAIMTGATKEVINSFDGAIDEIDKVGEALVDVKSNVEDLCDEFEDLGSEFEDFPAFPKFPEFGVVTDDAEKLKDEVEKMRSAFHAIGDTPIDKELEKSMDSMTKEAKKAPDPIRKLGNEAERAGKKAKEAGGGFASFVIVANQAIQLAQTGISAISKPLEMAGKFQTMQMSLEVLLGSADKAEARLKELSNFTKQTTFELPEVVQASKELQSLGKYSQDTLKMLSNLAMGSGKSLEEVTKAYSGLARGRKNMAVELFRDIGITTEDFVKATGKSVDKATGQIKASSKEMLDALGQIVKDKNFEGLIEKQSQTFEGQLGNFKDSWNQFLTELGMAMLPVATTIIEMLSPALEFVRKNLDALIPITLALAGAFGVWKVAIIATTLVTKGLTLALAASGIGIAVLAIGALIGALVTLQSALKTNVKAKLEDNEAERESLKTQKEKKEATLEEAESMEPLLDKYQKLAKTKETAKKNSAELTKISKQLNDKYTDLNINTNDFYGSLEKVRNKAKEVTGEIKKYKDEISELDKQITETNKRWLALNIDKSKEDLLETLAKDGNFMRGKGYWNDQFRKYFKEMYKTEDFATLDEIQANFAKEIQDRGNWEPEVKLQANNYLSEMIENRKKYLNSLKGIWEEEKKGEQKTGLGGGDDNKGKERAKTAMEHLAEELSYQETIFRTKKALLDENEKDEEKHNEELLKLETDFLNEINKIRAGAENRYEQGEGKDKDEYSRASSLLTTTIEKDKAIKKEQLDREQKHWNDTLATIEKGEQEIARKYSQGVINTQNYTIEINKLYADLEGSALNELYKKWKTSNKTGVKLSDDEIKIVDSIIKQREGLFQKVTDVTVRAKNIEMAELSKALSLKDADFQNGKIKLEEYTKFVTENIEKLASELDKPEYKDIFKKFQEGELTDEWLDEAIEQLKKDGDKYADALNPILKALEEFRKKKEEIQNEITNEQQLYGNVTVGMMESISTGLGEAIASGFGEEGFRKLSENLFQGFKMILISTLEYIEKEYLLSTAKSILEAIFNPAKAAVDTGLLVGAGIAIETAKVAINSWTPHFAMGGGVTGPTYLLAGEHNRKEYIISPEQMKHEVREAAKSVLKDSLTIKNSMQQSPINVRFPDSIPLKMKPVESKIRGKDIYTTFRLQERRSSRLNLSTMR